MLLRTTFLHMDRTQALEDFALKKIASKIERKAQAPVDGLVTFKVENNVHTVKLHFKDKVGEEIHLQQDGDDMYDAVNKLALMLDRTFLKRKGRTLSKRSKKPTLTEVENTAEERIDAI